MEDPSTYALIVHGGALDHLRSMPDGSIDSVICDPPYGLSNADPAHVTQAITRWASGEREFVPSGAGFMGAGWDSFVPPPALWDECLRVLNPGGHLAAFAGSRTMDLMGLSIRLSGFEIRDSLAWIYGSGMPHGQDVGKVVEKQGGGDQWEGWNTALKPSFEPIVLARKPLAERTVASNVLSHGTGAMNIDATRIAHRSEADRAESEGKNRNGDYGTRPGRNTIYGDFSMVESRNYDGSKGRHPANTIITHSSDCAEDCAIGCQVAELDSMAPGGPSRFFLTTAADGAPTRFMYSARASAKERPKYTDDDGKVVQHISVKPLEVMRWLVRLLTPPGGTVLDPFAGSGTTMEAAALEGFDSIVVEMDDQHIPLIFQRAERVSGLSWDFSTPREVAAAH